MALLYAQPRFILPNLDGIEDVESYRFGGYHPICIGDTFDHGRYRILHKLGNGGSSTVWLARDQKEGNDRGKIVALKAMRSDLPFTTGRTPWRVPDLAIPKRLRRIFPESVDFQTIERHFFVRGPNGSHLFLIYPLAGPSILSLNDTWGGGRRLRADVARKLAKQVAMALNDMHSAGIVHGDLTASNILFCLSPHVIQWSDAEVYTHFGDPVIDTLETYDGTSTGPHAPCTVVEPIEPLKMAASNILQERIVISDFGQSYVFSSPPRSYRPGTMINYASPEVRFDGYAGFEADIWNLGCTIFEIRAGLALFEPLSSGIVFSQMVQMLGRLPNPWWSAAKDRAVYFTTNGQLKSGKHRYDSMKKLLMKEPFKQPWRLEEGPLMEKNPVGLPEEEADLLEDLVKKMLKYRPEKRICLQEVINHPWFML